MAVTVTILIAGNSFLQISTRTLIRQFSSRTRVKINGGVVIEYSHLVSRKIEGG